MGLAVGDVISFERSFTAEDVGSFSKISGDTGSHHLTPDEQGRLIIQGLLTATLPTKIGGDYNVLARKMTFEFLRPVFTTDTIVCEVTIEQFADRGERTLITAPFVCKNQDKKVVMTGSFSGIIIN